MKRTIPDRSEVGDEFSRLFGGEIVILLDGNIVSDVLSFDIPGGAITRLKRREDGRFDLDLEAGEARIETLRGRVSVCWAEKERRFG